MDSSSNSSSTSSNRDMYLNQLNKNSHKISKPNRKPLPPPPPPPSSSYSAVDLNQQNLGQNQTQSQQPPVYNINKNDFRDVVQKLTGSPAHERFPAQPPPPAQSRPPSSRLQRIRPPPLAQIGNRPPQLNPLVPLPQITSIQPFTPLPPLPSVHTAAESPISAYMRFLQTSSGGSSSAPPPLWNDVGEQATQASSPISAYMKFLQNSVYASSVASPRWNSVAQPPPPPPQPHPLLTQHQPTLSFPMMPISPLPFGCALSPRSPYGMMSPSLIFSPTGQFGLPQLPLSPTVPVQSPKWKSR